MAHGSSEPHQPSTPTHANYTAQTSGEQSAAQQFRRPSFTAQASILEESLQFPYQDKANLIVAPNTDEESSQITLSVRQSSPTPRTASRPMTQGPQRSFKRTTSAENIFESSEQCLDQYHNLESATTSPIDSLTLSHDSEVKMSSGSDSLFVQDLNNIIRTKGSPRTQSDHQDLFQPISKLKRHHSINALPRESPTTLFHEMHAREHRKNRRYSVIDYRKPHTLPKSPSHSRISNNKSSYSEPNTPQIRGYRAFSQDCTFERTAYDCSNTQLQFTDNYNSLSSSSSSSSSSQHELNWSEYSARKAIVRFRTRKSAQERRTPVPCTGPSKLVHKVFHNQYDIARSPHTRLVDKLMAVFYCWYFGWLTDVYNYLTSYGRDRSLVRWVISCVLVSSATMLVAALLIASLFFSLQFVMSVLEASLWFAMTIVSVFVFCLCAIAIFNFD